jgi:Ca2+-binding RTX toxin-like protein
MATLGTAGFDVLEGEGSDNDVLQGLQGNDLLLGNDGDDALAGGSGNDWLYGGDGDDVLGGGGGNDMLTGGPKGGKDSDTFTFSGKSGKDTITDFDVDNDLLQIAQSKTIKTVADVLKHTKQLKNGDLEINLGGGNKIILKDVAKADFKTNPEDHIVIT